MTVEVLDFPLAKISRRTNDKENDRMAYDVLISPRALREIYLMPFMLAEKYAKPWSFMTAYAPSFRMSCS